MRFPRSQGCSAVLAATVLVLCSRVAANDPQAVLAPTGTLRIGVYPGSPTSEIRNRSGELHGVTVEVGEELGRVSECPQHWSSTVVLPKS